MRFVPKAALRDAIRPLTDRKTSMFFCRKPFEKISILTSPSSSSQATYHLRRAFSFHCKAHRSLILPLLASKPDPLRWAPAWVRPVGGCFCPRKNIGFDRPFQKVLRYTAEKRRVSWGFCFLGKGTQDCSIKKKSAIILISLKLYTKGWVCYEYKRIGEELD